MYGIISPRVVDIEGSEELAQRLDNLALLIVSHRSHVVLMIEMDMSTLHVADHNSGSTLYTVPRYSFTPHAETGKSSR